MIKNLQYKVTFTTGRTLQFQQAFDKGTTAITGRNEAGKSMVVEMIRYALFGTDALRGKTTDYDVLTVTLAFMVRGKDYRIERNLKGARLFEGGNVAVTGTAPVNKRVVEIFSYDLTVFDVANVAGQGDIEKLSSMKPTERKLMVDRLIGADRIDGVVEDCTKEALLLKREIEVLERDLMEPIAPMEPDDYTTSTVLRLMVSDKITYKAELEQVKGWLQKEMYEPKRPVPINGDANAIHEALMLLTLPVIDYDPEEVAKQWQEFDLWMARERFAHQHPRASMTLDQCQKLTEEAQRQRQVESLSQYLQNLRKAPKLTCPCGKEFTLNDAEIEKVEADLEKLGPAGELIDMAFIQKQLDYLRDWDMPSTRSDWEKLSVAVETPQPVYPRTAPARALARAQRVDLELKWGTDVGALRATLLALEAYARAQAVYESDLARYQEYLEERDAKLARFTDLVMLTDGFEDLQRRLREAEDFERARDSYRTAKAAHDARVAEIETAKEDRKGWLDSKAALQEVRLKIKTHLVPSLNRVASHLITQMTGGERSRIVVDEDFEVMVDGQRLATLSGSGKACANLALRIGLGQVLTNNVFSVFIGDELDAAMDQQRSTHTQTSLRNLADKISQIFIITHKTPTADTVIQLGN